jgi:hypothetical protein
LVIIMAQAPSPSSESFFIVMAPFIVMAGGLIPPSEPPPSDLQKLQFDYAWKWFSYHADQRVKMFNFMLIVMGIFAAGIVNAVASQHVGRGGIATFCFFAAALAMIFAVLDRRNRDLVHLGEELLTSLERNVIFGENTFAARSGRPIKFGIL